MADTENTTDDAVELVALERLIRRSDGFALAFARVNALPKRRRLIETLAERLGVDVRVVPVDVPPDTTDLEALLARMYDAEKGSGKVALFVVGVERVLSSVRERNGFLPVLNYKRENLQREVPCPVVVWLPEFALRLVAEGAPDVWAWRSGVFEFAIDRDEADRTWETLRESGTQDEYASMMPDERRARIETLEALFDDYANAADADEPLQMVVQERLANRLSRLYIYVSDLETALEWANVSFKLSRNVFAPDNPTILSSLNNLGYLLKLMDNIDEAEIIYREVLEKRERLLGMSHFQTLLSVSNLAQLLQQRGNLVGAEALYRRTLSERQRTLGPSHLDTLRSVSNLGYVLHALGDLDGAEVLYRRALSERERVLGPDHPSTLTSSIRLGGIRASRGDLDGAETLYRRAISGFERRLGRDHSDTVRAISDLARLRYVRGDIDEAEALLRRAVDGAERSLGPEHSDTVALKRDLTDLVVTKERVLARASPHAGEA